MKLIDKDALVAEIERIVDVLEGNSGCGIFIESQMVICEKILSFLDTLEVKEVDLEEEIEKYYEQETYVQTFKLAKHFFELGLKVQRESKFESCIQEGDKIVTNDDGTHFNISQLERVSQKATESKEAVKEFLKKAGIMDENGELADEYKLEKQDEQKPANKVEPKFKVGDWITNEEYVWQIDEVKRENYLLIDSEGNLFAEEIAKIDSEFHLWAITDAKDGDVLFGSEWGVILMFRGIGNAEWDDVIDYHCYYDYHRKEFIVQKGLEYWGNTENNQLKPATKEQRDLLFQKMHEAGYEWDVEKKELKKIEPKFKVGDWVVDVLYDKAMQILFLEDDGYEFDNGIWIPYTDAKERIHKWTIQDAKDGDVLCDGIDTVIYKKIRRNMFVHCGINNRIGYWYEVGGISPIDYSPATKEQRDLLFQKMKEAGFEWDDEKKVLKKIEQKSNWSEYDEEMFDAIIADIQFTQKTHNHEVNQAVYEREIDWLKSLKERLKGK